MLAAWKLSGPASTLVLQHVIQPRCARTLLCLVALMLSSATGAIPIAMQNGTATFTQGGLDGTGPYHPDMAIDGATSDPLFGWTIDHFPNNDPQQEFTTDETAVWEAVPDVGPGPLTFTLYFAESNPHHLLGHFRLSATTDDRSTFADGLASGGDVTANWTVLVPLAIQGPAGMIFTALADGSVLAGGSVPGQGIYTVRSETNLSGITGIRLEALKDPSLPRGGPGFAANGNFVLTEIQLDASPTPEPSTIALVLAGLALISLAGRQRARIQRDRPARADLGS